MTTPSIKLHVLEKLWAVSRVLLFASRTPKHVMTLKLVNRAFCECMIDYNVGASILDRIFDARNEWQSEDDVKTVWVQAAAIMRKQEEQEEQHRPPLFDPDLVAALVAAIRSENQRAAIEYARIPHNEREAAWRASPHHVFFASSSYKQRPAAT